jgi:hypothetical protein
MNRQELIDSMCKRNGQGDKSVCIGGFTIDYYKESDIFVLVFPGGFEREITFAEARKYMGER